MVQAALHRTGGDAEDDGNLEDIELLAVPQSQQLLPVRWKPPQSFCHCITGTFPWRVFVHPSLLGQGLGELPPGFLVNADAAVRDSYPGLWRAYRVRHPELDLPEDMVFPP